MVVKGFQTISTLGYIGSSLPSGAFTLKNYSKAWTLLSGLSIANEQGAAALGCMLRGCNPDPARLGCSCSAAPV